MRIYNPKLLSILYRSLVTSQSFGDEFFFDDLSQLDTIKRQFFKALIGLPNGVLNEFVYLSFFDCSLESEMHLFSKLSFYLRTLQYSSQNSLLGNALDYDSQILWSRHIGWKSKVWDVFNAKNLDLSAGFSKQELKRKLFHDLMKSSWDIAAVKSSTSHLRMIFPSYLSYRHFLFYASKTHPDQYRAIMGLLGGPFNWMYFEPPRKCCAFCLLISAVPLHLFSCPRYMQARIELTPDRSGLLLFICENWRIRNRSR
jgi:hypothetical protein